jgi:hypothetical protein
VYLLGLSVVNQLLFCFVCKSMNHRENASVISSFGILIFIEGLVGSVTAIPFYYYI